ncbi:MAG: hypothetical protein HYU36_18850 [Planctomycetes bacterium]|nr:hypothetical protein [Planctomycetota bacterium]
MSVQSKLESAFDSGRSPELSSLEQQHLLECEECRTVALLVQAGLAVAPERFPSPAPEAVSPGRSEETRQRTADAVMARIQHGSPAASPVEKHGQPPAAGPTPARRKPRGKPASWFWKAVVPLAAAAVLILAILPKQVDEVDDASHLASREVSKDYDSLPPPAGFPLPDAKGAQGGQDEPAASHDVYDQLQQNRASSLGKRSYLELEAMEEKDKGVGHEADEKLSLREEDRGRQEGAKKQLAGRAYQAQPNRPPEEAAPSKAMNERGMPGPERQIVSQGHMRDGIAGGGGPMAQGGDGRGDQAEEVSVKDEEAAGPSAFNAGTFADETARGELGDQAAASVAGAGEGVAPSSQGGGAGPLPAAPPAAPSSASAAAPLSIAPAEQPAEVAPVPMPREDAFRPAEEMGKAGLAKKEALSRGSYSERKKTMSTPTGGMAGPKVAGRREQAAEMDAKEASNAVAGHGVTKAEPAMAGSQPTLVERDVRNRAVAGERGFVIGRLAREDRQSVGQAGVLSRITLEGWDASVRIPVEVFEKLKVGNTYKFYGEWLAASAASGGPVFLVQAVKEP